MNHDVYVLMFLPCRVVSAVDCSAFQDLLSQQEHHEAVLTITDAHNCRSVQLTLEDNDVLR